MGLGLWRMNTISCGGELKLRAWSEFVIRLPLRYEVMGSRKGAGAVVGDETSLSSWALPLPPPLRCQETSRRLLPGSRCGQNYVLESICGSGEVGATGQRDYKVGRRGSRATRYEARPPALVRAGGPEARNECSPLNCGGESAP